MEQKGIFPGLTHYLLNGVISGFEIKMRNIFLHVISMVGFS